MTESFEPTKRETRWARPLMFAPLLGLVTLGFGNVTGDWRPMYLLWVVYILSLGLLTLSAARTRRQTVGSTVAQVWRTGEPRASGWLVEVVVDLLPRRLWKAGNLYSLPFGNWHFCVAAHPEEDRTVRTIEWRDQQIAMGRRPAQIPKT